MQKKNLQRPRSKLNLKKTGLRRKMNLNKMEKNQISKVMSKTNKSRINSKQRNPHKSLVRLKLIS